MKTIKWMLAVYLIGWLGMWVLQKAAGKEIISIPGITKKTSELGFTARSERDALVSRTAKVRYNAVLSYRFPWFLPKVMESVCTYDNIAENKGLLVTRNDPETLLVTCMGRGEAVLHCMDTRWILACDPADRLSLREE